MSEDIQRCLTVEVGGEGSTKENFKQIKTKQQGQSVCRENFKPVLA